MIGSCTSGSKRTGCSCGRKFVRTLISPQRGSPRSVGAGCVVAVMTSAIRLRLEYGLDYALRLSPCQCLVADEDMFCGDICSMLVGKIIGNVRVSSELPEDIESDIVPRCACGHDGCGDGNVSGEVH